jgi:two-component sensor histidine kinase
MGSLNVSKKINERIQALGRSYEPTLDDAFTGQIEIGQAIRAVVSPYDPEGDRIRFHGNGARAEPKTVSVIGLTLHELGANASKYGALSNEAGFIDVAWRVEESDMGRQLVIDWRESGGPPLAGPPQSEGTGYTIAQSLLQYSRGTLRPEWNAEGLHAVLTIPVAN